MLTYEAEKQISLEWKRAHGHLHKSDFTYLCDSLHILHVMRGSMYETG